MRIAKSALALVVFTGACAANRYDGNLRSSADAIGYAQRYPEALAEAQRTFDEDAARARELTVLLPKRIDERKAGDDAALLLRVIDEADAAGASESYARARRADRELARFWSEERGGLAARTSAAAQKELADGACAEKDLGPAVQGALKDGLDRPRERRLRASNEAQRTLELHKARLAPGSLPAWQRAADDVALASHYARVALREDVRELERLLGERSAIEATLARAVDDERVIQRDPRGSEQKASQERVIQIERARASIPMKDAEAQRVLETERTAQRDAERAYEQALEAIRERLRALAAAPPGAANTPARSVKQ